MKSLLLSALFLVPVVAIAATNPTPAPPPAQAGTTNNAGGLVIPADVRAGLGDKSNTAKVVASDTGFLGVKISHLPANFGAIVEIIEGGPAEQAKLKVGDVLVMINGKPLPYDVNGVDQITPALAGKVGEVVELTVSRGGKLVTAKLTHKKMSFKTVKGPDGQEKHVPVFE